MNVWMNRSIFAALVIISCLNALWGTPDISKIDTFIIGFMIGSFITYEVDRIRCRERGEV